MISTVFLTFTICFCNAILVKTDSPNSLYYTDEKMKQTVAIESVDSFKREIQDEVAQMLGLPERRKPIKKQLSPRNPASKFIFEIYNSLRGEEEPYMSTYRNRIARSTLITKEDRTLIQKCNNIVTFSGKVRTRSNQSDTYVTISFNINDVPQDLQLIRAELRIFQNSRRTLENGRSLTISIYQQDIQGNNMKLWSTLNTTTNFKGWLEVNVTNIISQWLSEGYAINGHDLMISTSLTGHSNKMLSEEESYFVASDDVGMEEYQPFIIAYFNGPELLNKIQHLRLKRDLRKIKKKRYTNEYNRDRLNDGGSGENYKIPKTCERMNFSIDFTDLQMQNWVIAPTKFEAYFCGGECNFPLSSKMNATNHAIVQTLMHLKQPNLPKPCCVPTVLSSISILHYLNEDSVNLSTYPNSVVRSCGCL